MGIIAVIALLVIMLLWIVHSIVLNRRLIESQNRYLQFFSDSPAALIVIDKQHRILEWNQAAEIIFGWSAHETVNRDIIDFIVPSFDKAHVLSVLQKAASEGVSHSKNYNVTKYKDEIFCEWHNRLLKGTEGNILCIAQDITQLNCHIDALTHRAHHDPLTGATNRATMDDRLNHAIERAERASHQIALFFIDLNDFKSVNDRYGHEAGDRLLFEVARNLQKGLRTSDTVSRYGGDEFVIIIEEIQDQEHIETIFKTIEAAIHKPIFIDSLTALRAKASIGMAIYPYDATDAKSLIKAADKSMYAVKREKNNSYSVKQKTLTESVLTLYADNHSRQNKPTLPDTLAEECTQ